jgi:hypothetical protein
MVRMIAERIGCLNAVDGVAENGRRARRRNVRNSAGPDRATLVRVGRAASQKRPAIAKVP